MPALLTWICLALLPAVPGTGECSSSEPFPPGPLTRFATFLDVDYTGPSVEAHCGQRYNLFLPDGEAPDEGWPLLVYVDNSGFRQSRRRTFIDIENPENVRAAIAYLALTDPELPMAVVYASTTVSRGGASGVPDSDASYDPWATPGTYGPAYFGNGLFLPPGFLPAGYPGSLPPYADPLRPMPEKDVVMLVQHVQHHADALPPGVPGAVKIDRSRIVLYGSSAAATLCMWTALGADRAAATFPAPVAGSQEEVDTTLPAAMLSAGIVFWRRFVQDQFIGGLPSGIHFPAQQSGSVFDQAASVLAETPGASFLDAASALFYGDDGASGPVTTANSLRLVFLSYSEPSSVQPGQLCFANDPLQAGLDLCWYETDIEQARHPSWSGHAWKVRFPNAFLVTTLGAAYTHAGLAVADAGDPSALPDEIVPAGDFAKREMAWLRSQLLGPHGRWSDVGSSLAGGAGAPHLSGSGSLKANAPTALVMTGAAPHAPVALIMSSTAANLPFLGGVLVPSPEVLFLAVPATDAFGRWVYSSLWPKTPVVGPTFFQVWVGDATAPFGAAATNALMAVTP